MPDTAKTYPVRFWQGAPYQLWGLIGMERHCSRWTSRAESTCWEPTGAARDIFSRLVYGARISLSAGLMGVAAAFGLGLMIGVFSGVSGGRTEQAIMRLCELVMSVPAFFLMLALRAVFP